MKAKQSKAGDLDHEREGASGSRTFEKASRTRNLKHMIMEKVQPEPVPEPEPEPEPELHGFPSISRAIDRVAVELGVPGSLDGGPALDQVARVQQVLQFIGERFAPAAQDLVALRLWAEGAALQAISHGATLPVSPEAIEAMTVQLMDQQRQFARQSLPSTQLPRLIQVCAAPTLLPASSCASCPGCSGVPHAVHACALCD